MSAQLSKKDIVRAVTNDPALSDKEVVLGDVTIKIVDLSYDDYEKFLVLLQPVLDAISASFLGRVGLESNSKTPTASDIMTYCRESIPDMALLSVRQTYPSMTRDELKALAKSPFRLATIVVKQIEQNRVIEEVGDFFVQILPFLPWNRKKTLPPV